MEVVGRKHDDEEDEEVDVWVVLCGRRRGVVRTLLRCLVVPVVVVEVVEVLEVVVLEVAKLWVC